MQASVLYKIAIVTTTYSLPGKNVCHFEFCEKHILLTPPTPSI